MKVKYPFRAMGSSCEIIVRSDYQSAAQGMMEAAVQEVLRLEKKYSFYAPDSYLSDINTHAAQGWVETDKETGWLLGVADRLNKSTKGLYDPTIGPLSKIWDFRDMRVPHPREIDQAMETVGWDKVEVDGQRCRFLHPGTKIDLGGIVKEYAVDRCAQLLNMMGADCYLINLGGDMALKNSSSSGKSKHKPWNVGVSAPRDHKQTATGIEIDNGFIVTSGDYHRYFIRDGIRYHHLLNPKTGRPIALKYAGVTFVGGDTALETSMSLTSFYYSGGNADSIPANIESFVLFDTEGRLHPKSKLLPN